MKEIIVKHGVQKDIVEKLDLSRPTVRAALRGYGRKETVKEIRALAIKLGGVYAN